MGIGLIIVCAANDLDRAIQILRDAGEAPYVIGDIISGAGTVTVD
jgi:phosphoribosylaminoimidazole (AIR) synthetase